MNLLLKNIIYYVISGVGFFSLNMFGIGYNSPIISIAAIPMMIILSVYTLYINKNYSITDKLKTAFEKPSVGISIIPFIAVLSVVLTIAEGIVTSKFSVRIISSAILTFMIGLSEEGTFRNFIISYMQEKNYSKPVMIVVSTIFFSLLHMVNIAAGLSVESAFIQTVNVIPFGLLAAFFFVETGNISALIFWHMYFDFSLFISEVGIFYSDFIIGIVIDILLIIEIIKIIIKYVKKSKH